MLAGHQQDWDDWSLIQVKDLYDNGRGFPERSHVHTATYEYVGVDYRDPDGVPLTLALDHKYDGIVALWLTGTPFSVSSGIGFLAAAVAYWLSAGGRSASGGPAADPSATDPSSADAPSAGRSPSAEAQRSSS